MANSILRDVKKVLALNPDDTDFDLDILMHINAVITILEDLGAGPINGFSLVGNPESTWDDYFGNGKAYDAVKTYIYLRVRVLFDPPSNSFVQSAIEKQIDEFSWRISNHAEAVNELV